MATDIDLMRQWASRERWPSVITALLPSYAADPASV